MTHWHSGTHRQTAHTLVLKYESVNVQNELMVSIHFVQCTVSRSRRTWLLPLKNICCLRLLSTARAGNQDSSLVVPQWWNDLPRAIWSSDSHDTFKEYHKVFKDSPLECLIHYFCYYYCCYDDMMWHIQQLCMMLWLPFILLLLFCKTKVSAK